MPESDKREYGEHAQAQQQGVAAEQFERVVGIHDRLDRSGGVTQVCGVLRQLIGTNHRKDENQSPALDRCARSVTPDEAKRFMEAAAGDPNETLLLTAISTGLHPGELLSLHWADVDLDNGTFRVRRA